MALPKKPEEIELMRVGGRRLAQVVSSVATRVAPGVSTAELNEYAEALIREGGDTPAFLGYTPHGAKRPYPATMCISVNDAVVHGIPNEEPLVLREGDVVSLDCGLVHEGLIVDHAITVAVGTPDERAKRLMDASREALNAAISVVKAGAHVGDIGAAVEEVAMRYNLGIAYELGGHGVGYAVHEEPYIGNTGEPGSGEKLASGMVLALEPILTEGMDGRVKLAKDGYTYLTKDGTRAAHFEHTIVVTESGAEILTTL